MPRPDSQLVIWDAATGKVRAKATSPTSVFRVAFTPDGRQLVGAGGIGGPFGGPGISNIIAAHQTYVWDGADGAELKLVRATHLGELGNAISLPSFELSFDGLRVALWTPSAHTVRIVDTATGELWQTFKTTSGASQAGFVAGSTRLLTLEKGGTTILKEWTVDAEKLDPLLKLKLNFAKEFIVWSADGKRQAVFRRMSGAGISIRHADGKEISACRLDQYETVDSVKFSPNGKFLCGFSRDSIVKIFETETGKTRWSDASPKPVPKGGRFAPELVLSPFACHRCLVLPEGEKIRIVNFDDLEERFSLSKEARVALSPDGKRLVVLVRGAKDAVLWDVEAAREIASLSPIVSPIILGFSAREISAATFSEDSRLFATSNPGRVVTVWDAVTGKKHRELEERIAASPSDMTFNKGGTRLAVLGSRVPSSLGPPPSIYDVNTGKLVCRLEGHVGTVSSLAFSSDGKRVATFAFNLISLVYKNEEMSAVKLWDPETGRELLSLPSSGISTRPLSFSLDSHRLTLGGWPEQIWDATPRDANAMK